VNDFNNDGNMDVCFMGGDDTYPFNLSSLAFGSGSTTFTLDSFFNGNIENAIVDDADFDHDGDADLVWDHFIIRNDLIATGTPVTNESKEFSVFPNPADQFIEIKTKSFEKGGLVSVVNQLGAIVMQFEIKDNLNGQRISISELPAGAYLVKMISAEGESPIEPFIISR